MTMTDLSGVPKPAGKKPTILKISYLYSGIFTTAPGSTVLPPSRNLTAWTLFLPKCSAPLPKTKERICMMPVCCRMKSSL